MQRSDGRLRRAFSFHRSPSIRVKEFALTTWKVQGVQRSLADDFAHICLEMHWGPLLFFILAVYTVFSFLFASALYSLDGDTGIGGEVPPDMSSFEVCLWFSAVNLITAGFGALVPLDRSTYVISTAAHFTGLLLNSLLLGIVVAKASLPTAKMVFSNVIVVRTRNHVQQLMVRVGNARGNILYSPDIRFAYIRAVQTAEGETFFEDSHLQVKVPAALKPVFMITHAVTQDSILNGKSEQDIVAEKGFFLLIVSATDVETGQSLYARRLFFMNDFRFNHMFKDVVSEEADSRGSSEVYKPTLFSSAEVEARIRQTKCIDFLRFHDTLPLAPSSWQGGCSVDQLPHRVFGQLKTHSGHAIGHTGTKAISQLAHRDDNDCLDPEEGEVLLDPVQQYMPAAKDGNYPADVITEVIQPEHRHGSSTADPAVSSGEHNQLLQNQGEAAQISELRHRQPKTEALSGIRNELGDSFQYREMDGG